VVEVLQGLVAPCRRPHPALPATRGWGAPGLASRLASPVATWLLTQPYGGVGTPRIGGCVGNGVAPGSPGKRGGGPQAHAQPKWSSSTGRLFRERVFRDAHELCMTTTTGTSPNTIGSVALRQTSAASTVDANVLALKWGRPATRVSVHALCHLLVDASAGVSLTHASSQSTALVVTR